MNATASLLSLVLATTAAACAATPPASAPKFDDGFVPVAPDGVTVVATIPEQVRMHDHILGHVDRRFVSKVVRTTQGEIVDCVDRDRQPGCAALGCGEIAPPPAPPPPPGRGPAPTVYGVTLAPLCDPGTVPVVRASIDAMRRFHTFEEFEARTRATKHGMPGAR